MPTMTDEARARNREQSRRWAQANREKVAEMNKRWRSSNPEKVREYNRKWQESKGWDNRLRRTYGITLERYEEMLEAQDGKCALCLEPAPDDRRLAVDHDHSCCSGETSCGKCVRALLCSSCNLGLGLFKDNPATLLRAAHFLENEVE